MTYYEMTIDGKVIIEAESEDEVIEKFEMIRGYTDSPRKVKQKTAECKVCGLLFNYFYRTNNNYCSSKCRYKDSDSFYWDRVEKDGFLYKNAKHDVIEENELAKKKGLI